MMFPTKFDLNTEAHDETMSEGPSNETEIKIACRYVMIGNYCYTPKSKVHISSDGVSIPVPKLTPAGEDTTVHIPLKSIVNVLTHAEHSHVAAILLYTEAKTGERVRGELGMRREGGPYFDPLASEEPYKRIVLLPAGLARRRAAALRTLFGMVLDEPGAADPRLRALPLRPNSRAEGERAPSAERRPSPVRCTDPDPESPRKSSASSSSSIIFPPSPAPISLSSPSSVRSPKSSRSSRKRKSRSKKSKNKKMKYVLVKNPEPNSVDAFLTGVAPILKSLNPVLLNLAKSEIISAALKYERKMLTDNCIGNGGHSPNHLFPE